MVGFTKFSRPRRLKTSRAKTLARPAMSACFQRHFLLAVIAQFLYVGAQVGTWSYFILYVRSATGVGDKAAGYMLTGTLAAFAVGRFGSALAHEALPGPLACSVSTR
jgi:fucose permease